MVNEKTGDAALEEATRKLSIHEKYLRCVQDLKEKSDSNDARYSIIEDWRATCKRQTEKIADLERRLAEANERTDHVTGHYAEWLKMREAEASVALDKGDVRTMEVAETEESYPCKEGGCVRAYGHEGEHKILCDECEMKPKEKQPRQSSEFIDWISKAINERPRNDFDEGTRAGWQTAMKEYLATHQPCPASAWTEEDMKMVRERLIAEYLNGFFDGLPKDEDNLWDGYLNDEEVGEFKKKAKALLSSLSRPINDQYVSYDEHGKVKPRPEAKPKRYCETCKKPNTSHEQGCPEAKPEIRCIGGNKVELSEVETLKLMYEKGKRDGRMEQPGRSEEFITHCEKIIKDETDKMDEDGKWLDDQYHVGWKDAWELALEKYAATHPAEGKREGKEEMEK